MVNICFFPQNWVNQPMVHWDGLFGGDILFWGTLLAIPNMAGNKTSQKIKGIRIIIIENEWFSSQQGYINY